MRESSATRQALRRSQQIYRVETAAPVIMTAKAPPPTNEQTTDDSETRNGPKIVADLCRASSDGYGAPWYFQPIKA